MRIVLFYFSLPISRGLRSLHASIRRCTSFCNPSISMLSFTLFLSKLVFPSCSWRMSSAYWSLLSLKESINYQTICKHSSCSEQSWCEESLMGFESLLELAPLWSFQGEHLHRLQSPAEQPQKQIILLLKINDRCVLS